jgi:hypothetical protein
MVTRRSSLEETAGEFSMKMPDVRMHLVLRAKAAPSGSSARIIKVSVRGDMKIIDIFHGENALQ